MLPVTRRYFSWEGLIKGLFYFVYEPQAQERENSYPSGSTL